MTTLPETAHTVGELDEAIQCFYPEGTNAEWMLMRIALVLQSSGKSLADVLPKSEDSPFVKLVSRE